VTDSAKIITALREFMKARSAHYRLLEMAVFGSVAREEATEASDVDIAVRTETADPYNIVHLKEALESHLRCRVDIVRLREQMNPRLKKRIEREAIYV